MCVLPSPEHLSGSSQRVGPPLAHAITSFGSRKAFRVRAACGVFRASQAPVRLEAGTFPRRPCRLGAPGRSRGAGALSGLESKAPSVSSAQLGYSALRLPAARFRACQPPNPSIERDVQELSLLAAPHVKR